MNWMADEKRRRTVVVNLRNLIIKFEQQAAACRESYHEDYMGVPFAFLADALEDAAKLLQSRLDAVLGSGNPATKEHADATRRSAAPESSSSEAEGRSPETQG